MITLAIDTTHALGTAIVAAKNEGFKDPRFLWASGILVATLLIGAFVLSIVERWRKRQFASSTAEKDSLNHYREMYQRGELNKEEYIKIRDKLAAQYLDVGAKSPGESRTDVPSQARNPGSDLQSELGESEMEFQSRADGDDGSTPTERRDPPVQE